MSKSQLKKEIKQFTATQLRELLLDIYDSKMTAKEYLDYFINPDEDKLIDKTAETLQKEVCRTKRYSAKFRISRIKEALEKLRILQVDTGKRLDLAVTVLHWLGQLSCNYNFTEAQGKSIKKYLADLVTECDRCEMLSTYYNRINDALHPSYYQSYNRSLMSELRIQLRDYDPMSTIGK